MTRRPPRNVVCLPLTTQTTSCRKTRIPAWIINVLFLLQNSLQQCSGQELWKNISLKSDVPAQTLSCNQPTPHPFVKIHSPWLSVQPSYSKIAPRNIPCASGEASHRPRCCASVSRSAIDSRACGLCSLKKSRT